ncbi:hypothetical protein HC931_09180 [Candidatus Gracilibacteria bacterium]|jgi:hypothetical protein|nr:hypothetical protein [Candidatus Gracilibacteria bacterium]NJM88587.1 hypothetical protein [Hydrococcus sp. RU_2_2]NJP21312.1 hypothetical protein [Hydrococcus sp. CRU_1_1]NJQ97403.1 hypothetical protein [Hydrococcus sp. CSU_1_8]
MLSLNKGVIILLLSIFIFLLGALMSISPAHAITINFQWTGTTGYLAKGSFSYDETISPKIISEKGIGTTNVLQSLSVSFYTPSGELINHYEDIVNGVAKGNYFEFNFDTETQQIFGFIDIGGEVSGETYLKGIVNDNLSLFSIDRSGLEKILDDNFGSFAVASLSSNA